MANRLRLYRALRHRVQVLERLRRGGLCAGVAKRDVVMLASRAIAIPPRPVGREDDCF
jgi:hypothetical protein